MDRDAISISDVQSGAQSTDIIITDTLQSGLDGFEEVADAQYAPLDGLAPGSREAQERQRAAVEELGLPLELKSKVLGISLRLIPAGIFLMGSPTSETDRRENETQHCVTISRPFYMAKYEVTQAQWQKIMGANPSRFEEVGANAPVESVSWNDCQELIKKLDALEGLPRGSFRLPTEAEWEYACRAGTTTRYYTGDNESDLARAGWYGGNRDGRMHSVGQKEANTLGLYDMHGNVLEWCQDWYGSYSTDDATDPRGPQTGVYRVLRGGSWYRDAGRCRSADRSHNGPDYAYSYFGLRLFLPAGQ